LDKIPEFLWEKAANEDWQKVMLDKIAAITTPDDNLSTKSV